MKKINIHTDTFNFKDLIEGVEFTYNNVVYNISKPDELKGLQNDTLIECIGKERYGFFRVSEKAEGLPYATENGYGVCQMVESLINNGE